MGQRDRLSQTDKALSQECEHPEVVTTETAGIERAVCESCGHVSIRFIREGAVWLKVDRLFESAAPDETKPPVEDVIAPELTDLEIDDEIVVVDLTPPTRRCSCGRPATFMIPGDVACGQHAWDAASAQDPLYDDLWIPVRIDQGSPKI